MNERLIQELAQGLKKSREPWSPGQLLRFMFLFSLSSGLIFLVMVGPRHDLASMLPTFSYSAEVILLLSLAALAYVTAAVSSIPGRSRGSTIIIPGLLLIVLSLAGIFASHTDTHGPSPWSEGWHCLALITANAFLPTVLTLVLVRRHTAPTRPGLTMAFILLGSLGAAISTQHLICPYNETWHLVIWHLAVLPGACLLAQAAGSKILSW